MDTLLNEFENQTVAEIVTENFSTAAAFQKLGIDFCCGGNVLLKDACEKHELAQDAVVAELRKAISTPDTTSDRYEQWDLDFLSAYIEANHHAYVREKSPIISEFAARVVNAHGVNHPEVLPISGYFEQVKAELDSHMFKEEKILFPRIKQMALAKKNGKVYDVNTLGSVQMPIRVMEAEHVSAGDALKEIQRLSNNYQPPQDACNTFKAFYHELQAFENDLHKHIHLENNILFPKAIVLENAFLQG